MTVKEFGEQIDRLKVKFGAKHYDDQTVTLFWNKFQYTDLQVFTAAVDFLLSEERYAPMLSKIETAVSRHQAAKAPAGVKPKAVNCEACSDTGHGFVLDRALRCSCPAGQRLSADDLARIQASFEQGRRFFRRPETA